MKPVFPQKNLLLVLFSISLISIAIWLWTAPFRAERSLRSASLDTLQAEAGKHPYNPRVHYYLGLRARELGQADLSHQAFRRAAELDNNDETSWLAAANAAGSVAGDQEAFGILTTYLQKHPESHRAHFALAELYMQRSSYKRAYEEAMAATDREKGNAEYWRVAGTAAQKMAGMVQMAGASPEWQKKGTDALLKAVQLAPKDWRIRISYGNILLETGNTSAAIAEYREAVRIAPDELQTHLALGRALLSTANSPQDIETARQSIQKSLELGTQSPQAYSLLGQSYLSESRWKEARAALEKAQNLAPTSPDIAFNLAQIYKHLGEARLASEQTERHHLLQQYLVKKSQLIAQMQTATTPEPPLALARFCREHDEFVEAASFYRRALALGKGREDIRQELAVFEQQYPEAVLRHSTLSMPDSLSSTSPVVTLLRDADTMFAQKKYSEANMAYQHVLDRDQNNALAFQGVGLTLIGLGKQNEAFPYLNAAVRLNSGLALSQFQLARFLNMSGFSAQAVQRLQKATEADPNNSAYWYALGLAYRDRPNSNNLAVEALGNAAKRDPNNPVLLADYAELLHETQQSPQAEKLFRQALSLAPDNPDIKAKFGMFLLNYQPTAARAMEAEVELKQALEKMPDDPYVLFGLGRVAFTKGHPQESVSLFMRSVTVSPATASVWYWLARAYQRTGKAEKAKQAMAENQRLQDSFIARSMAEEKARDNPKDAGRQLNLARLCVKGKENSKAISLYRRVLTLDPKNTAAANELGSLESALKAAGQMPDMSIFDAMVASFEKKR